MDQRIETKADARDVDEKCDRVQLYQALVDYSHDRMVGGFVGSEFETLGTRGSNLLSGVRQIAGKSSVTEYVDLPHLASQPLSLSSGRPTTCTVRFLRVIDGHRTAQGEIKNLPGPIEREINKIQAKLGEECGHICRRGFQPIRFPEALRVDRRQL